MRHRHFSKVKGHRKRSSFTQQELSYLLGLKQHGAISRYESGERTPDLKTALACQVVFGRDLTELFPELLEEVRAEVAARATQLSQDIGSTDGRRGTYKQKQLRQLAA